MKEGNNDSAFHHGDRMVPLLQGPLQITLFPFLISKNNERRKAPPDAQVNVAQLLVACWLPPSRWALIQAPGTQRWVHPSRSSGFRPNGEVWLSPRHGSVQGKWVVPCVTPKLLPEEIQETWGEWERGIFAKSQGLCL